MKRRILGGLVVIALSSAAAAAETIAVSGWTRVVDQRLHAFSFEVPQGWGFIAGTPDIRPTSPSFAMSSPDGSVVMIYNQLKVLNAQQFPLGWAQLYQSSAYLPAPYYIVAYGAPLLAEQCQSPKLERLRHPSDIERAINAAFPVLGTSVAADAMFSCERMGKPSLAYIAVGTRLFPPGPKMGMWQVDFEEIVIAPNDQIAAAIEIMTRSLRSIEWSQAYVQAAGQILSAANQAAMRALGQTLHESHQVDNIINGVGDHFSPATDTTVQPPVGIERYYQDGLGIVWGSNGGTIKPNCQQLTPMQ
jgi:hypothetical protein